MRHLRVHRLAPHTAPTTAAAAPPSPRARRLAHKDWTHLERVARTELELTQHDDERALDVELELIQHLCPPAFALGAARAEEVRVLTQPAHTIFAVPRVPMITFLASVI